MSKIKVKVRPLTLAIASGIISQTLTSLFSLQQSVPTQIFTLVAHVTMPTLSKNSSTSKPFCEP